MVKDLGRISMKSLDDKKYLKLALEQARKSVKEGGFPVGAIVVKDGKVISEGISVGYQHNDPTGHAETVAIRAACNNLRTPDLNNAVLYGSLECCTMCFSVAYWANISKIVYACRKTPDMVKRFFYEGYINNEDINKKNNRKIELIYIPDFENESLEIIGNWQN